MVFVLVALVGFSSGLMLEAWFVFLGVVGINCSLDGLVCWGVECCFFIFVVGMVLMFLGVECCVSSFLMWCCL